MSSVHEVVAALFLATCACSAVPSKPAVATSSATTEAQADLEDVRMLAPDIDVDMPYAGTHNFTGGIVEGYDAPRCLLLRPAAEALARVQASLRPHRMRLRVYDCYRPVRAVQAFMERQRVNRQRLRVAMEAPRFRQLSDGMVALHAQAGADALAAVRRADNRSGNHHAASQHRPPDAALYDNRLLSDASRALEFSPHVEVTGEPYNASYGFGWRISVDMMWHSGETIGSRNRILRWPKQHLAVILLSNRNDHVPFEAALSIARLFMAE